MLRKTHTSTRIMTVVKYDITVTKHATFRHQLCNLYGGPYWEVHSHSSGQELAFHLWKTNV